MFRQHQQKTPKYEELPKGNYIEHQIHTLDYSKKIYHDNFMIIGSIDPAVKNFCIRIEKRYMKPNIIDNINNSIIPIVYFRKSLDDSETSEIVETNEHKKSHGKKIDLGEVKEPKITNNINTLYLNLYLTLDSIKYKLLECDYIIIEKQLTFGRHKSLTIEHHTMAYIINNFKDTPYLPRIIEMDAKTKGKVLGSPSGINERAFKKWCTEKAKEILIKRNDTISLKIMNDNKPKLDDLSDTVCQIEALFKLFNLPLTEDLY